VTPAAREVVEALLAARNAGSREQVRALLAPDATYWDCLGGRVGGAEAVTESLVASGGSPRFVVETLAAAEDRAVMELRVSSGQGSEVAGYPVTEVYELRRGLVAGCRAYLDPEDVGGA
jgi:limonene-1,2-epoxide hydrolase